MARMTEVFGKHGKMHGGDDSGKDLSHQAIEKMFPGALRAYDSALISRTDFSVEDGTLYADTSTASYMWSKEDREWFGDTWDREGGL